MLGFHPTSSAPISALIAPQSQAGIENGGIDVSWGARQQSAWLREQRIKRQNEVVLAVVMAAVTQGML